MNSGGIGPAAAQGRDDRGWTGTPARSPRTSNIGKRADLVFWSLSGTVTLAKPRLV